MPYYLLLTVIVTVLTVMVIVLTVIVSITWYVYMLYRCHIDCRWLWRLVCWL